MGVFPILEGFVEGIKMGDTKSKRPTELHLKPIIVPHRTFRRVHTVLTGGIVMQCRIRDMRNKEVINVCDGCRLGFVADVDIKLPEGQVIAIIVFGPYRWFGLFGRGEEYYIPWDCIQRIGDDIILIDKPFQKRDPNLERRRRQKF